MRGTGSVLVSSAVLGLVALQGWTMYVAHYYGYHAKLGPPWWEGHHFWRHQMLYAPWRALVWSWQWGWQVPGSRPAALGTALALVVGGVCLVLRRPQGHGRAGTPPPMTGHGTTKWASMRDVKESGLL